MPQPIKLKHFGLPIGPAALAARPDLALHIAYIAAIWSKIELILAATLGVMLGASYKPSMTMYFALRSAREDALDAVAMSELSGENLARFKAIKKELKARAKQRNTVIHALWTCSPKYPDALLMHEIDEFTFRLVRSMEPVARGVLPESNFAEDEGSFMKYETDDFLEIEDDLKRLDSMAAEWMTFVTVDRMIAMRPKTR